MVVVHPVGEPERPVEDPEVLVVDPEVPVLEAEVPEPEVGVFPVPVVPVGVTVPRYRLNVIRRGTLFARPAA